MSRTKSVKEAVVDSFSLQTTFKKLFKPHRYDKEDQELEIFNLVKLFAVGTIILGNTFFFVMNGPLRNLDMS